MSRCRPARRERAFDPLALLALRPESSASAGSTVSSTSNAARVARPTRVALEPLEREPVGDPEQPQSTAATRRGSPLHVAATTNIVSLMTSSTWSAGSVRARNRAGGDTRNRAPWPSVPAADALEQLLLIRVVEAGRTWFVGAGACRSGNAQARQRRASLHCHNQTASRPSSPAVAHETIGAGLLRRQAGIPAAVPARRSALDVAVADPGDEREPVGERLP